MLVHLVRWIGLGSVVGVLAGLSSAGFLITLDWVTEIRLDHPWLLWLLPVAGLRGRARLPLRRPATRWPGTT